MSHNMSMTFSARCCPHTAGNHCTDGDGEHNKDDKGSTDETNNQISHKHCKRERGSEVIAGTILIKNQ